MGRVGNKKREIIGLVRQVNRQTKSVAMLEFQIINIRVHTILQNRKDLSYLPRTSSLISDSGRKSGCVVCKVFRKFNRWQRH